MKKTILLVAIILLIGAAIFYSRKENAAVPTLTSLATPANPAPQALTENSSKEVSFSAPDGYVLRGTFWSPSKRGGVPALILVHQFRSDRHDFDSFIPQFLNAGYAVLAYDIRGFGESKNGPANINDFPKDIDGAVTLLKTMANVDANRIGVIGASVGANVAYVASGSIKDIKAAVSLSPSNTGARGVLLGNEIENFSPHAILIASDENEKIDADFIYSHAREPKERRVYPGFGHGIGILRSETARNDTLVFLGRLLKNNQRLPASQ